VVADQLREKLIKIGAKVVSHGRYVTFQMAEVVVSRQMFQEILMLIARRRPVEVRVDQGSAERLLAPQRDRPPVSERLLCTRGAIVLAKEAQGLDHDLNSLGNLGNVG
jgi:hypothetical protein